MLKKAGCTNALISGKPVDVEKAERIILPGVGHFEHCMAQLKRAPFFETLQRRVLQDHIPLLGVCVGHQMLFEHSEEGNCSGLGWIPGKVQRFEKNRMNDERLKIPHMAWTDVEVKMEAPLFLGLEAPRFYFVHSYHAVCDPSYVTAAADYGYEFTVAVCRENIQGVQFHPEKSHRFGMQLLSNFATL